MRMVWPNSGKAPILKKFKTSLGVEFLTSAYIELGVYKNK